MATDVSRHCYGYAVDVSLFDPVKQSLLDMGSCFDFFGEISHTTATKDMIGEDAYKNRQILQNAMEQHGFISYEKEYWHFDYQIKENDNPIDVVIDEKLRNIGV